MLLSVFVEINTALLPRIAETAVAGTSEYVGILENLSSCESREYLADDNRGK